MKLNITVLCCSSTNSPSHFSWVLANAHWARVNGQYFQGVEREQKRDSHLYLPQYAASNQRIPMNSYHLYATLIPKEQSPPAGTDNTVETGDSLESARAQRIADKSRHWSKTLAKPKQITPNPPMCRSGASRK